MLGKEPFSKMRLYFVKLFSVEYCLKTAISFSKDKRNQMFFFDCPQQGELFHYVLGEAATFFRPLQEIDMMELKMSQEAATLS